ncbi:MAG TPA: hypothetical protein VKX25_05940 [Bryobacteraceae bacterium]|nr:hypothetical protein [Bryobacteraceae bacterium]
MYLFDLFRSFLPLRNPIGFGAADFVVFSLALLLSILLFARVALQPYARKLAQSPAVAMLTLFALGLALRLALLAAAPVPIPAGADDFSYILLADTLRHLRLANPPHPLSQFFEAVFILQHPTYSSIYPPGQGIALALGRTLFGSYWAGVLLVSAALPALCYWMLRAWIPAIWALAGGLLAVVQFGPLNPWTNSYWGGSLSACAGCLVFGALPRLGSRRAVWLLGLGLSLQLLTRPFEFVLLCVCVFAYAVCLTRPEHRRMLIFAAPLPLLAFGLLLAQNKAVTGGWTQLPYQLSRYQYGVPASFTFEPNPVPHNPLTPEQELDYRAQAAIHGSAADSPARYVSRLLERLPYARFFLLAPLFLALPFAFRRRTIFLFVLTVLGFFFFGTNFYPYFHTQYIAAVACLFLLWALCGMCALHRRNPLAAVLLICLCGAHFVFWYAIHLSNHPALLAVTTYETWDFVNHGDPEGRISIARDLAAAPGDQLVFVRYTRQHRFGEWIANAADIGRARIIWALDLGADENQKLERYFPSRKKWLLEPDFHPPHLTPYPPQ